MNKINIDHSFTGSCLVIDTVNLVTLGEFWRHATLSGGFWRLYRNFGAGAGVNLRGKKIELSPDKLYLLPPYVDLVTWRERPVKHLFIHFEYPPFFGNPDCKLNAIEFTPELESLCERLHSALAAAGPCARTFQLAAALAALAMSELPEEAQGELARDRRISRVCEWMRDHPDSNASLPELAAMSGFSPNGFLRRFREVTGISPARYFNNLRYNLAAKLLENSRISIKEICEKIGVSDRFHFSRTFKSRYGASPAAYRRQYRSSGDEINF